MSSVVDLLSSPLGVPVVAELVAIDWLFGEGTDVTKISVLPIQY